MSLRVKLAIAMVVLATGATVAVGSVSYFSTQRELRQQIDRSLTDAARLLPPNLGGPDRPNRPGRGQNDDDGIPRNFTQILVQVIDADGDILREPGSGPLPVTDGDVEIAARTGATERRRDLELDGEPFRVLTVTSNQGAVQLARSLEETERVLDRIRSRTLVIILVMGGLALGLGLVIAERVTRRLVRLTGVESAVARSGNVDGEVPAEGGDEAVRLGQAFSAMLA